MSDDEDDVVVNGRSKRSALNKSGRKRLRTLTDSSDEEDEDLFNDSDGDDPGSDDGAAEQADHSFSKDALKKALTRLTGCLDPSISYEEDKMSSWAEVDAIIVEKKVKLRDLLQLVEISNSRSLSLETKCVISTVAAQTCRLYEEAGKPKECNQLFLRQDKNDKDKSNHLANFVSNRWLQESAKALSDSPKVDEADNMHVHVLQAGLIFIKAAYIVNAKVLKNLKEKQNIDWVALVNRIKKISVAKNLDKLRQAVESANTHLAPMIEEAPNAKAEGKGDEAKATNDTEGDDSEQKPMSKMQRLALAKTKERLEENKRKAHACNIRRTSSTASTGNLAAAATAQATSGVTAAPAHRLPPALPVPTPAAAPVVHGTWGTSTPNDPAPSSLNGNRPPPAAPVPTPAAAPVVRGSWGTATSSDPSSSHGRLHPDPLSNPMAPASARLQESSGPAAPVDRTAIAPSRQTGYSRASPTGFPAGAPSGAPPTAEPTYKGDSSSWRSTSTYGTHAPRQVSQDAAPVTGRTGYSDGGYGRSQPDGGRHDQYSAQAPPKVPHENVAAANSSSYNGNYPEPGSQVSVPVAPQATGESSNYNHGSAWSGGAGWNGNDARNESSWNASSSKTSSQNGVGGAIGNGAWGGNSSNNVTTSHDNQTGGGGSYSNYGAEQDDYQRKRRPPRDNNQNNKRPRNDRNVAPRDANPPVAPVTGAGRGRGLGQTLPAWMTQGNARVDAPAGMNNSSAMGAPPPAVGYNDGPSGVPPNSRGFDNSARPPPRNRDSNFSRQSGQPGRGGRGRGRGRGADLNLPAWMTDGGRNEGPPGVPPTGSRQDRGPSPGPSGFPDPGASGGGRGRGMTLPAWMTQSGGGANG